MTLMRNEEPAVGRDSDRASAGEDGTGDTVIAPTVAIAALAWVAIDLGMSAMVTRMPGFWGAQAAWMRFAVGSAACMGLLVYVGGRTTLARCFGLVAPRREELRAWAFAALAIAAASVVVVAFGRALGARGGGIGSRPIYTLVTGVLLVPPHEEMVYRVALFSALRRWLPARACVVIDGLVFAALHWIYGIPDATNQLGGFILAWSFHRSGSVVVPLALHASANLAILLAGLAFG